MRTDEALNHHWFSGELSLVRRRENIKYPSSRLRRTCTFTFNKLNRNNNQTLLSLIPGNSI